MDTLKIICYGCGQKLDVSELAPFQRLECPSCKTKLTVPKTFGNYLLEEILGDGELATSYRANDLTLDREVVVKVLKPDLVSHPEVPQLYLNEARSASAINHPHVLPIFLCGEQDGQPFLTMQFMPGQGLDRQIDPESPAPLHQVVRWFMEAAKGLDAAALHGMLHHDLRPSNLLLDLEGNLKITDFGLISALAPIRPVLREGKPNVSRTQALYMSPERLRTGRQEVAGDIFSFGAVFYHVATGHPPYPGDTAADILAARATDSLIAPRKRRPDIPASIDGLIRTCMAADPSERPRTYAELVIRLKDALGKMNRKTTGAGVSLHPPPHQDIRVSASTRSRARTKVVTMDTQGVQKVRRRHPMVLIAMVAIPLLIVVVVALLLVLLASG